MAKRKPNKGGRSASAPSFQLKFEREVYTPAGLQELSLQELKREYTRVRDAAQKRLKRLAKDPIGRQSPLYEQFSEGFRKLKDLGTYRSGIERELANMALFISSSVSTVGGTKKYFRDMKRRADPDDSFDAEEDFDWQSFDDWMQQARENGLNATYGSETAVQYYYIRGGVSVSTEDFYKWMKGQSEYERKEPEPASSSQSYMRGNYKSRGNF